MEPIIIKCPPEMEPLRVSLPTPNQSIDEINAMLSVIWGGKSNIPQMSAQDKAELKNMDIPKKVAPPKATYEVVENGGTTNFICDGKSYPASTKELTSVIHAYEQGTSPYHLKDIGTVKKILTIGSASSPAKGDSKPDEPCTVTPFVQRMLASQTDTPKSRMEKAGVSPSDVKRASDMLMQTISKLKEHRKTKSGQRIDFSKETVLPSEPWMPQMETSFTVQRGTDRFVSAMESAVTTHANKLRVVLSCAGPPPSYLRAIDDNIQGLERSHSDYARVYGHGHPHVVQLRQSIIAAKEERARISSLVGIT